jgi:hypothetical protein
VRSGKRRVQLRGHAKLTDGIFVPAGQPINRAQIVVRDRVAGSKLNHSFELLLSFLLLSGFLISDSEIEPSVRDRRILLLNLDEFGYAFGRLPCPQ